MCNVKRESTDISSMGKVCNTENQISYDDSEAEKRCENSERKESVSDEHKTCIKFIVHVSSLSFVVVIVESCPCHVINIFPDISSSRAYTQKLFLVKLN